MNNWIILHKYEFLGGLGFIITNFFAWIHQPNMYQTFEVIFKILGLILGVVLMILSIIHKRKQLHNEEVINKLQELKLLNEEALRHASEIKKAVIPAVEHIEENTNPNTESNVKK